LINHPGIRHVQGGQVIHEGLGTESKPYYALWVYKVHSDERFDLLGNSLAILFGIADSSKAKGIISWVETACEKMQASGELALPLPPCLIPFIYPHDEDWRPRYQQFNQPGEYHNGGIWPFIVSFYIAALVAAGQIELAMEKFTILSQLVQVARSSQQILGFNEWFRAQDGQARGQDWQTWSAAMYIFAAACVEHNRVFIPDWNQPSDDVGLGEDFRSFRELLNKLLCLQLSLIQGPCRNYNTTLEWHAEVVTSSKTSSGAA
jgi:hypothetical protein